MSPAQKSLYCREWSACATARKKLGLSVGDEARHALTAEALGGVAKSMKDLRNAELDRVLAKFRTFSQPDNLDAQLAAEESTEQRRARYLREANATLEEIATLDPDKRRFGSSSARLAYLDGTARKVLGRPTEALDESGMRRLLGIVARPLARAKARQRAAEKAAAISEQIEEKNPF